MRKVRIVLVGLGLVSIGVIGSVKAELPTKSPKNVQKAVVRTLEEQVELVYRSIDFGSEKPLSKDAFHKAYLGYLNLKEKHPLAKEILSVADYSLSSNEKRLWVIDLQAKKLLYHSLVAHGQGTGDEYATRFSNTTNSHQTSLGFFLTDETYMGSNGYSLRLHGFDGKYNDRALARAIVIHGASYVSPAFIQANRRLGRSWGCPALPNELTKPIINTIKGGTVFFAYYPDEAYLAGSQWLKPRQPLLEDRLEAPKGPRTVLASNDYVPEQKSAAELSEEATETAQPRSIYQGIQLDLPSEL